MFSLTQKRTIIVPVQQNRSESNFMSKAHLYKRQLLSVQDAATILSNETSKRLLEDIKRALQAPTEAFNACCLPLIHHVAELVQRLPCPPELGYKSGLLNFLLARCSATLRLLQDYLGQSYAADYILTDPDLWRYTLFSVVLLQHIGQLVSHYHITLFDDNEQSIGAFSAFSGSMCDFGQFYQTNYNQQGDHQERDAATLLLARQLMPTVGLNWIHQSSKAFRFWTKTLIEDTIDQGGRWYHAPTQILTEALARILNRTLPSERLKNPKSLFDEKPYHELEAEKKEKHSMAALIQDNTDNTHAAESFLEDLAERLDLSDYLDEEANSTSHCADRLMINTEKSSVHCVEQNGKLSWFISTGLISEYANRHDISTKQLLKQLFHLGVLSNGNQQARLSIGPDATRMMSGATLSNIIGKGLLGSKMALLTNVPTSPLSATLKLHGDANIQRIVMMNNGTWPALQPPTPPKGPSPSA